MRFTIRQLMFAVAAFSVWCGAMATGNRYFGVGGAVGYGAFVLLLYYFAIRISWGWRQWYWYRRLMALYSVLAIIGVAAALTWSWIDAGISLRVQHEREQSRITDRLQSNPRFAKINITRDQNRSSYTWPFRVTGTVANQEDLDALRAQISAEGLPVEQYSVTIRGH